MAVADRSGGGNSGYCVSRKYDDTKYLQCRNTTAVICGKLATICDKGFIFADIWGGLKLSCPIFVPVLEYLDWATD